MKTKILFIIIGFVIAFLVIGTIRFATFQEPKVTHYHANFSLFINGKQYDLSKDKYMQPVSSCTLAEDQKQTAIERVHLHNNQGESVHVHDDGVTWNNFVNNIKFTISKTSIITDENKIFNTDDKDNNKIKFVLDGNFEENPLNFEIGDKSKLLINYGTQTDEQIMTEYKNAKSDATDLDSKNDPATCTGNKTTDFWTKVRKSFLY